MKNKEINSTADEFKNILYVNLNDLEELESRGDNAFELTHKQFTSKAEDHFLLSGPNLAWLVYIFKDGSLAMIHEKGITVADEHDSQYSEVALTLAELVASPQVKLARREESPTSKLLR